MNKKKQHLNIVLSVIMLLALALLILLFLTSIMNWIWILRHEPESGETVFHYFLRCMIVSSSVIVVQIGVLFFASTVLSLLRGRHSVTAGILSTIPLFLLDLIFIEMGLLHYNRATSMIVLIGLPLLVTGLQWLPNFNKRKNIEPEASGNGVAAADDA